MFLFTDTRPYGRVPAFLDWKFVHENMAWSVILLLGGGFALADAVKVKQYSVIFSFLVSQRLHFIYFQATFYRHPPLKTEPIFVTVATIIRLN